MFLEVFIDKEMFLKMRKIITESQLRNIINETIRRMLNEGKDANQLADAFVRKNPNIDKNGLIKLLMADPTASQNDRGSFAGRYGVWIGNMYANGSIKPGDAPELKSALFTYDKNKTQLPQIKDCKSLPELIGWVKDLSDDFKPVRRQSKAKADLEKVYEDDDWVVYVPHSHAAARRGVKVPIGVPHRKNHIITTNTARTDRCISTSVNLTVQNSSSTSRLTNLWMPMMNLCVWMRLNCQRELLISIPRLTRYLGL